MPVVKSIATPIIWVLVLLVGGLLLSMLSKRKLLQRAGWYSILLGVLALLAFSLNPVSNLLAYSLECRYALFPRKTLVRLMCSLFSAAACIRQAGFVQRPNWTALATLAGTME